MKDNEIVKDMEICIKYREERECGNCSRIGRYQCAVTLMQDAFGLINRQKAEIERLEKEKDIKLVMCVANDKEKIKSEAIKEFADEFERRCINGGIYPAFVKRQFEHVKEEMVGDKE